MKNNNDNFQSRIELAECNQDGIWEELTNGLPFLENTKPWNTAGEETTHIHAQLYTETIKRITVLLVYEKTGSV